MAKFEPGGLHLMDEPEAALSFVRQLALMRRMQEVAEGGGQFVVATHSPILLAFPDAADLPVLRARHRPGRLRGHARVLPDQVVPRGPESPVPLRPVRRRRPRLSPPRDACARASSTCSESRRTPRTAGAPSACPARVRSCSTEPRPPSRTTSTQCSRCTSSGRADPRRSAFGDFAGRLVEDRDLVGGAQLIARTRCVRVGARDAEVELAQLVDHRPEELGAAVTEHFGADP